MSVPLIAAEVIGAIRAVNGLIIAGQELKVTLGGKELTDEEINTKIDEAILQVELNRDND